MKENLVTEALKQTGSVYLLINVASKRAEQILQAGSTALQGRGNNPVEAAMREIADRKLRMEGAPTAWRVEE